MPQLALGNGQMHEVGAPVEDAAPEQAAEVPAEPTVTPCRTAFTVQLWEDGDVTVDFNVWNCEEPQRKPTFDEIYHGATVISWHVGSHSWRVPGDIEASCVTAFTPYLTHDGRWLISADVNDPLVVDREPSDDEIIGGLAVVVRDIQTQEILNPLVAQFLPQLGQGIVQNVIGNMVQLGQQAAQAKDGLDIAQKLEQERMRRGGR